MSHDDISLSTTNIDVISLMTILKHGLHVGMQSANPEQVTISVTELAALCDALDYYKNQQPTATLIYKTCDSGALSTTVSYGYNAEEKVSIEQNNGQCIPLFRHD